MLFKNKILNIILGYRATSDSYIKYLKKRGVKIGHNVEIFRPFRTTIDFQNPHLLTIGNNVQMTGPVTILTHDYSWCVLKRKYGYIYGNQQRTTIGNNVFIGWGATILGGTEIGDNVIIGANSLITGKVEGDSVYAGNPGKKIMTLTQFRNKRQNKQLEEAKQCVLTYKKRFGVLPPESELDEYFFLFRKDDNLPAFKKQMKLMGNYKKSRDILLTQKPMFKDYNEFLKFCLKNGSGE